MGMGHAEFWGRPDDVWTGLTVREFVDVANAHRRRQEAKQDLVFMHAAHLMNMWSKKAVKLEQLTGRKPTTTRKKRSATNFAGMDPAKYQEHLKQEAARREGDYIAALTEDTEIDADLLFGDDEGEDDTLFDEEGRA